MSAIVSADGANSRRSPSKDPPALADGDGSAWRGSQRREDLPTGCVSEFAPSAEMIALIARAVEAKRHCCRFLRFGMTVEPEGGPVFLELTGPAGTRDFVSALIEG